MIYYFSSRVISVVGNLFLDLQKGNSLEKMYIFVCNRIEIRRMVYAQRKLDTIQTIRIHSFKDFYRQLMTMKYSSVFTNFRMDFRKVISLLAHCFRNSVKKGNKRKPENCRRKMVCQYTRRILSNSEVGKFALHLSFGIYVPLSLGTSYEFASVHRHSNQSFEGK